MQPSADFRTRVKAVRLESKSLLQAVRADRLARLREAIAGPAPDPDPRDSDVPLSEAPLGPLGIEPEGETARGSPDGESLIVSAIAARVSRLAKASWSQVAEHVPTEAEAARSDPRETASARMIAQAPTAFEAAGSEPMFAFDRAAAPEREAETEAAHVSPPPDAVEDAPRPAAAAPELVQASVFRLLLPSVAEAGESDLKDLPGAGPGLIWMLRKLGVHSQADLARADPEDLSARLGVIGQLLDMRGWIAFARQSVAADETAA